MLKGLIRGSLRRLQYKSEISEWAFTRSACFIKTDSDKFLSPSEAVMWHDYRSVALMSHIRLHHTRPQVHHALNPFRLAYWENMGVEDTITHMLYQFFSHLDRSNGALRITFLDTSSAFNTIQSLLLRKKTDKDGNTLTSGGLDYRLPDRQSCLYKKLTGEEVQKTIPGLY